MLDRDIILNKLNTLLKTEFGNFSRYCSIPVCNQTEENRKYDYSQYKKRIELLIYARNYIIFYFFFRKKRLHTEYSGS